MPCFRISGPPTLSNLLAESPPPRERGRSIHAPVRPGRDDRPSPTPNCSFVPPISMPSYIAAVPQACKAASRRRVTPRAVNPRVHVVQAPSERDTNGCSRPFPCHPAARAVRPAGSAAARPPSYPVRPNVIRPWRFAHSTACKHVGAVARAADGNHQIARATVIHQLLDENLVVGQVVPHRHDPAHIVGQAEHFQPFTRLVLQ